MNCYRHPDREAFVRCQRCERFICPACQTESAVGFLCPEDAGITTADRVVSIAPKRVQRFFKSQTVVTTSLIAVCVLVWVLQIFPGSLVTQQLAYAPFLTPFEPWRMITAGFLHSTDGPIHILFNMYSLWVLGRIIEPILGAARFVALYLFSVFGGSLAALWMLGTTDVVVGASGAIFGLMGAIFVVARSLRQDTGQFVGILAINLALGFLLPGIAWQAHLGGLAVGAAVAWIYSQTRGSKDTNKRRILLAALAVALLIATVAGVAVKLAGLY